MLLVSLLLTVVVAPLELLSPEFFETFTVDNDADRSASALRSAAVVR